MRDSDNISASDRPLSEKVPQYYSNPEDFEPISVNRYFTTRNETLDDGALAELLAQTTAVENGDRESVDEAIVEYFDSFWTVDALQERRVELLIDVLDVLTFDEIDDEFGLEDDPDAVRENVREQTSDEFEKRLSMRSL